MQLFQITATMPSEEIILTSWEQVAAIAMQHSDKTHITIEPRDGRFHLLIEHPSNTHVFYVRGESAAHTIAHEFEKRGWEDVTVTPITEPGTEIEK